MTRKSLIHILLVFSFIFGAAASASLANPPKVTFDNFDEAILDYIPALVPGVSEGSHKMWAVRLEETYAQARRDGSLNVADYWNMTMAFLSMQADHKFASISFRRAAEVDPESLQEYLAAIPNDLEQLLPKEYAEFIASNPVSGPASVTADSTILACEKNLDSVLVALMASINERDQRHREQEGFLDNRALVAAQNRLDNFNAVQIDSLYRIHECYIGTALVGKEYSSTMWAIVQHSNAEMMERYLPIIQDAVAHGDLPKVPLKMLIDRIYTIRTGLQIFGSQGEVKIADAETVSQVKRKYGF